MATLEKPHKEKSRKKKVNQREPLDNKDNEECDEVISIEVQSNKLNIVEEIEEIIPNSISCKELSSSSNEIDRKDDCISLETAKECSSIKQIEKIKECSTKVETEVSQTLQSTEARSGTIEEIEPISQDTEPNTEVPMTPSAIVSPSVINKNVTQIATAVATPVCYPNLTLISDQSTSSRTKTSTTQNNSPTMNLKPLTENQLNEFFKCDELELVKQFELEFLMNALLEGYENDPLHQQLTKYYNIQSKLTMNKQDIKAMHKMRIISDKLIWTKVPVTKTFSALCGDGISCSETVTYMMTKVDGKQLENVSSSLSRLYNLVSSTYTINSIESYIIKKSIDKIIYEMMVALKSSHFSEKGEIILKNNLDPMELQLVSRLRHAIIILFSFIRKIIPSVCFDSDLKLWLRNVISMYLLLATKEDHWFILFNILRCPSGVGTWASEFLQIPLPLKLTPVSQESEVPLPIDSPEMKHCITILQILLRPITKRIDFLNSHLKQEITDPVQEERWILIDSDGEDSNSSGDYMCLKENDIISLLNQIPFEKMFMSALSVEKFLNDYIVDADRITPNQMLKSLTFFSKLTELFGIGMLTYNTERYRQLAKRLGRFVKHSLQYIVDYHELFEKNNVGKNVQICQQIKVQLNAIIIKSCSYIYRSRNLSTWQYFSSLPYGLMSRETIWQIFYYLSVGFPEQTTILQQNEYLELCKAPNFWEKFNLANADSTPEDMYYLLQTFYEMSSKCDKNEDWELITTICFTIFNIGFINKSTRELCYKTARDMLSNLALTFEKITSSLLLNLKYNFEDIDNLTFLFKSLPLNNWKPNIDSFEILANWLLNYGIKTQKNMLSRLIISQLNWGFDCDGRLFLPHNIHVRMACLITEALSKHAPESIGQFGVVESMRQLSSLIDFSQSTNEHFTNWCWSIISTLRLHLMDQSANSIKQTLSSPSDTIVFISELEQIEIIHKGVTERQPLAIYVAMLISLHGHSIPIICQKGLDLLKLLLNDYRHAAAIRCLELILPFFLESSDVLANCEKFHGILNAILIADKTYLKQAKDIIYSNSNGPVLELFDNMIHNQITKYTNYGLTSPLSLLNVWLNCLTALPNWQNTSVVYLIDKILSVAYQFSDARPQVVEFFKHYFKNCTDWKGNNKMSTIKSFFSSNQSIVPTITGKQAWFALVLLEIEFQSFEANLWPEFLRQLHSATSDTSLDATLKKTASIVKCPSFPAQLLVIYKYVNLIISMDVQHPLYPIVNQKFFELYFSRVPSNENTLSYSAINGVSNKLFNYNMPLIKSLKTSLNTAESHYIKESLKYANDESLNHFYRNCAKITQTYLLWLEENSHIDEMDSNNLTLHGRNLPPQYISEKLQEIFNQNSQHWTEYIYLPLVRKEQKHRADQWAAKCFRLNTLTKSLTPPLIDNNHLLPIDRIKRQLSSYDPQKEPPKYSNTLEISLPFNKDLLTVQETKKHLKVLLQNAKSFNFKFSELNSMNRNYLDNVIKLYKMVPYTDKVIKGCTSLLFNRKCKSPAQLTMHLEKIRKDDDVDQRIQTYNEHQKRLLEQIFSLNVDDFVTSRTQLESKVNVLVEMQLANKGNSVSNTAINCFYTIVENLEENTMAFAPTNEFLSQLLIDLGIYIQANQEKEGLTILELILKRPELLDILSHSFVPCTTNAEYFINMYKYLINSFLKCYDNKILFVLFSKFDFKVWFEYMRPKLHEINELLKLVLDGLESWSQPNPCILHSLFRRHLAHIFEYDFPQHYGEVLQMVLNRVSEQKVTPTVLIDLINSLLSRFNCNLFVEGDTSTKIETISVDFAVKQNAFNLKVATDTVLLFARHFQNERLRHGLHGLYPKHKDYCIPLSMWFSCFGHAVVVSAICTYKEFLADQISDIVFGSVIDMYSPWLVTYTEENLQQSTAKWIRDLTDNTKMLYPWRKQHERTSEIIIKPFIDTLLFILDYLPASVKVLEHTFNWYVHHFFVLNLEPYVYPPIHEGIAKLPWEKFNFPMNCIDMFYESLNKFIPQGHSMLAHIFIRINWTEWFTSIFPNIPLVNQTHVISRLLTIFIKIVFEPSIHTHINTSKILEEAIHYPWHLVDYSELEVLHKWFVSVIFPSIILKIPSETNYVDRAVLDLLRLSSAMNPEFPQNLNSKNASAKRLLYIRSMLRMFRTCATKSPKLLANKNGLKTFNLAFLEMIENMDKSIQALTINNNIEQQKREAINLMIEILVPMQTESEEVSNYHISMLVQWQEQCEPGNIIICTTLNAINHMQAFISSIYILLETSINNYFKTSEVTRGWHNPNWLALFEIFKISFEKLEMMAIIYGSHILTLNLFIVYRLEKITNSGDQITFLQDMTQFLESIKLGSENEPKISTIWGLIISRSCKLLAENENAKKPLIMLTKYFRQQVIQSETWSETLLGAIGLKKDRLSSQCQIMLRCLETVIHSLFPDRSLTGTQPNVEFNTSISELALCLANKRYQNLKPQIVNAAAMINAQKVPELVDIPHLVCRLIGLFYEKHYITIIPEVWDFNFKLNL